MKVKIEHADGPMKKAYIDVLPDGMPLPVVGDLLSGKERPQGGCYVYKVTARRFHFDWEEVIVFVRELDEQMS